MKILVPCDFSNNAALYAAKFAKKVNAEIILFNVTHFKHPPNVQVGFKENDDKEGHLVGLQGLRRTTCRNDCNRNIYCASGPINASHN